MPITSKVRALRLIEKMGLARPRELEAQGISRAQLARLVNEGTVLRQARGIYAVTGHAPTAAHTLAQVAKRVPEAVFCLLTALRFHGLTTQSAAEVWIALPEKARRPRLDYPRLRVARFSGPALTESVEEHRAEGVVIRAREAGDDYQDLLTSYCFERLLYRHSVSDCRERFVRKGAMLLRLWSDRPYQAIRDLDLLRSGDGAFDAIRGDLRTIVATPVPPDGVSFDGDRIEIEAIRAEDEYAGTRANLVAFVCSFASARYCKRWAA